MKAEIYRNSEYQYSEVFWGKDQNRAYEHMADQLAIERVVAGGGEWIVDLGGGFGRLVPTLKEKAQKVILVDASMDLLREAHERYAADPDVYYVRANLYHLPFKNLSLARAVCLRVMHHIREVDVLFAEMTRVIAGSLYLEFPNKRHLLQRIRYWRGDHSINVRSLRPEVRDGMFYNFTLPYIKNLLLVKTTFSIEKVTGLSFFRNPHLKRLPLSFLRMLERLFQKITLVAEWSPSLMLSVRQNAASCPSPSSLYDLLACPVCHGALEINDREILCEKGHRFKVMGTILDLYVE